MSADDFEKWDDSIPWSPLHLLPLVWYDPSTMDEPLTAKGIVVRWNDLTGRPSEEYPDGR